MAPFELLLLSTLVASSIALPTTPSRRQDQHALTHTSRPVTSDYQCFDGTASTNSISASNWLSFDQLWHINEPTILSNNGGDTYIEHYIREAILQVSREDDIDARLIVAVMMQEVDIALNTTSTVTKYFADMYSPLAAPQSHASPSATALTNAGSCRSRAAAASMLRSQRYRFSRWSVMAWVSIASTRRRIAIGS